MQCPEDRAVFEILCLIFVCKHWMMHKVQKPNGANTATKHINIIIISPPHKLHPVFIRMQK
jgi:hypothetical protein